MKDDYLVRDNLIRNDDLLLELLRMPLDDDPEGIDAALYSEADRIRRENYGDAVYLRGLIEFTNHCRNNCYYCGIRAGNGGLERYRLDKETILACCRKGFELGYRTFVLQGGEDPFFADGGNPDEGDGRLCDIVSSIHDMYPDCAVTLSVGERTRESYRRLYEAGARRYLLRHEAASPELYGALHPAEMSIENRRRCLYDLKEIGYQVGAGLMVGTPGQTPEHLLDDIRFMQELQPDMIGIGPYIRQADTPFADPRFVTITDEQKLRLTLRLLAVLRIIFPYALIPSTTALGSIDHRGRVLGLKAGANVLMPNLSPAEVRDNYRIYDNKLCTEAESAEGKELLIKQVAEAGYRIVTDIGDVKCH